MTKHRNTRRPGRLWVTTVRRTRLVTPHMRRVTLTSPELAQFESNGTDQHIAAYFYDEGVELPRPFTAEAARSLYARYKPALRRYTIREARPEACEVDIDFVLHAEAGPASDWAASADEGDEFIWFGPTPAYTVDAEAPEHLLFGDETAVPAIAAILEHAPENAPVRVIVEVDGPEDEQPLPTTAGTSLTWLHRAGDHPGAALARVAAALPAPSPGTKLWGAAERDAITRLRRLALDTWNLPRPDVHLTAYWTQGREQDADRDD